jgi:hypothetical protein
MERPGVNERYAETLLKGPVTGAWLNSWRRMVMEIAEVEKRERDIKSKFESIRLSWVEAKERLSQKEAAEIRKSIEADLADLEDMIWGNSRNGVISN